MSHVLIKQYPCSTMLTSIPKHTLGKKHAPCPSVKAYSVAVISVMANALPFSTGRSTEKARGLDDKYPTPSPAELLAGKIA